MAQRREKSEYGGKKGAMAQPDETRKKNQHLRLQREGSAHKKKDLTP